MPAIVHDLTIEQGGVYEDTVFLKANGEPYPGLVGATAHMQIRDVDGRLLADLTSENGGLVIDAAAGSIKRRIGATSTAAMDPEMPAEYDMEVVPGGVEDDAFKLYRGKVKILREVTRG